MTQAFPLAWPDGWPRTPISHKKYGKTAFKRQVDNGLYTSAQPWTFGAARDALLDEVYRHTQTGVVLSSNFATGRNGPMEGKRRPEDEAVVLYFMRGNKPVVMACDRYHDAEGNMRSLALALEALRALERHGGGVMMDRAFEGFTALPAPATWWEVLGVTPGASRSEIDAAYRSKAAKAHPDRGGSHNEMAALNEARAKGLAQL